MSKLFSRAKVSLEHAKSDYQKLEHNDCYLDSCCFHLQQSIEFLLKGIVELNNAQYAENHDIRANLNILNRLNIDIPCEKELRVLASTLYSWETESRYKESFIAAINDIDDAFKIAETLTEYVLDRIAPIVVTEVEFPESKLSDKPAASDNNHRVIGIAKGKLSYPNEFDEMNVEITDNFYCSEYPLES